MTKTAPNHGLEFTFPSGTPASGYHLSDSLDWSSFSAQVKNRVVLVPVHLQVLANPESHKKIDMSPQR